MLRNTGSVVHIKLARHPAGTLDITNISMDRKFIKNQYYCMTSVTLLKINILRHYNRLPAEVHTFCV